MYIFILVPVESICAMLHHPLALHTLKESSAVALDGGVGARLAPPQHHLAQLLHLVLHIFFLYLHAPQLALGSIRPVTPVGRIIMSQLHSKLRLTYPLPCSSKGRQHTLEAGVDLSRK